VRVPDKKEQETEIGKVLSKYDDLIANNQRRIELLEKSARHLFKEWFVRLRYPGHEHDKCLHGVPEGWETKTPGEFIAFHIGGGWGQEEPIGAETEPAFVIRGTDIPDIEVGDGFGVGRRYHKDSSLLKRRLCDGDIVFEVSGGSTSQPVARCMLITERLLSEYDDKVICASFCKRFSFVNMTDAAFFCYHVREYREQGAILQYQKESASALKNFNFEGFLETYRFLVPPPRLRADFAEQVQLIVGHKQNLAEARRKLTQGRDLLLPRLMDGRLSV
jgi:type I restriction enzyme S subunit